MVMSKGILSSQVSEITQCVICTETFKEPKVLPCIHTFCLHCLEKYGKEKEKDSGDKLDCALCRKEFVIPRGGFRELPNNYFIIQLMQLKQLSSRSDSNEQSVVCDWCSELNEKQPATVYCIECEQHLCQPCCTKHAKPKVIKDHKVVSLKDKPSAEQLIKMVPSYCEKHSSKEIEFYCSDCKMVFCYVCYVAQHNKHKCCDLNESAETFSKQLKSDLDKLSPYILRNKSEMKQIEEKKTTMIQKVTAAKDEITKRYDSIKSLMESHHIQLMSKLNEFEKETLKELQTRKEEVERQCVILDSYKKYCEKLKENGTACEISRAANDLHTRANDLVKAQEEFMTNGRLLKIDIKLTPSLTETDSVRNWIGQLVLFKGEEEPSLFLVGLGEGNAVSNGLYRLSLTEIDMVSRMIDIPATMNHESKACTRGNSIYVTGTGGEPYNETWSLDLLSDQWFRCANMITGRRRHCALIFDSQLYVLGGWNDKNTLSSVESYNIDTNTWSSSGNLIHAVQSAACISYNNSIYVSGGICSDKAITDIQVYDPASQSSGVLKSPMPFAGWRMQAAVLWETSIILMHHDTCLLYNFETQTWLERKQFKTDLYHFGLVLNNQTIYIVGGGMNVKDKDNKSIWTCMDEVKSVSVLDVIEDKPVAWMLHAILPKPALIHAYCMSPFMHTEK